MEKKVYFETLGCSKNQVDTEIMLGILNENAYVTTKWPSEAHVIVVNTCGFIESAKIESVETILEMSKWKDEGCCQALVVAGCLSQRYAEELKSDIPEVDAFVGTAQFDQILSVLEGLFVRKNSGGLGPVILTENVNRIFPAALPRKSLSPSHYAFLKIAEGCDNLCTYCIIPKLRGRYRSRPFEDVVKEAREWAKKGVKELILIAQDTSRYGIDLYGKYRLADLLEALNQIEDLKWIRLQYMYPDIIDEHLIKTIASLDKVVKYVDIPIQHGADTVLRRMNRKTTQNHISQVVDALRKMMPNITIRTTCIVGFPGETEEEFENLKEFISHMEFDRLGAFSYSREENTPAGKMKEQILQDVKEARRDEIMALQRDISQKRLIQKIGTTMEVVVEELVENENGKRIYVGRSTMDAPEIDGVVYVHTTVNLLIGDFVSVPIVDALEYDLIGEML